MGDARERLTPMLLAARIGYAARGLVYLSAGLLAFRAAGAGGEAKGLIGAMQPIAAAPMGKLWLILIAGGLGCFALWRAIQAILDPDREGREPKGLAKRAGQGLSALVYAGLSLSLLQLIDEVGELAQADERKADAQARVLLGLPFGELLLMALGIGLLAAAAANALHGLSGRFQSGLDCNPRLRRLAQPVGRAGYLARGAAFALMGVFVLRAGMQGQAAASRGMGGALEALERQPGGGLLLALVGAGLLAFGLFGLLEARYRRFRTPDGGGAR